MSDADTPLPIDTFDSVTRTRLQQLAQSRSQLVTDVVRKAVKHYLAWLDGLPVAERSAVEAVAEYDANGLHLTAAQRAIAAIRQNVLKLSDYHQRETDFGHFS